MKNLFYFSVCLLVIACKSEIQNNELVEEKAKYDIYVPSEMSNLMNRMYAINLEVKEAILNGESPNEFPKEFLQIHTAELSDFKSRNETFESFSHLFLEKEKAIFDQNAKGDLKQRYNSAIGLCISCHQTECTGPIPKIKKLLIK